MRNNGLIVFIFLSVSSILSFTTRADNWSFQVEPYLMALNIEGEGSMGRATGVPINVNYKDILEHLDMAAMLHFEALHKSGWGLMMDYAFMDVSKKTSTSQGGFIKASLRQGILEALGFYRTKYGNSEIDYFTGVRWWDNNSSLLIDPAILPGTINVDIEEDWVDLVAGVRLITTINKDWNLVARADLGGFGISADFTSTVETGLTYKISDLMVLDLKYKATWVDYDNENNTGSMGDFQYKTIVHGPVLGLIFNF